MASIQSAIIPEDGKPLSLKDAFIRKTSLDGANLQNANLSRADMTGASARNADFAGAKLRKTIMKGTDLTGAKNLTAQQLSEAIIDETTLLPEYIKRSAIKQARRAKQGKLL